MKSPFLDQLAKRLDAVSPGVLNHLGELDQLPESVGNEVVLVLLKGACQSQHVGNIQAAREALAQIPQPWLLLKLPKAIEEGLNLGDEWEYRRLLELLKDRAPVLLSGYVDRGLTSDDVDIQESAKDFVTS